MGSIARLARAQGRCNRFPVFKIWATVIWETVCDPQDLGHFPSATHTAARCGFLGAPEGPIGSYVVHQWPASGREGFRAAVDRASAAWRLAPGSSAWCTRGAAGAQVRPRKWEPASSSGSATIKPTGRIRDRRPSRRITYIVAAAGLRHPISTCPDGQPGAPGAHAWGWPKLGPPVLLGRPRFDPTQTPVRLPLPAMSPWHPKGIMRPLITLGGPPGPPAQQ
jgi:hypothetical protein